MTKKNSNPLHLLRKKIPNNCAKTTTDLIVHPIYSKINKLITGILKEMLYRPTILQAVQKTKMYLLLELSEQDLNNETNN